LSGSETRASRARPRVGANAVLAALVAVGVSLFAGQATARAHDASGLVAPRGAPSAGAQPSMQPSMQDTYAAREAQATELASFKGGRVVVIAGGTVVIVLLVVLILVLL
jgi:hypothetical protein